MASGLDRAHKLQRDAAALGFDWPNLAGVLDKCEEELGELRAALQAGTAHAAVAEEFGDLLFVLVNLGRRLGVAPDAVLQQACDKFERRFGHVLAGLARQGLTAQEASLAQMESLWDEAKRLEAGQADLPE